MYPVHLWYSWSYSGHNSLIKGSYFVHNQVQRVQLKVGQLMLYELVLLNLATEMCLKSHGRRFLLKTHRPVLWCHPDALSRLFLAATHEYGVKVECFARLFLFSFLGMKGAICK